MANVLNVTGYDAALAVEQTALSLCTINIQSRSGSTTPSPASSYTKYMDCYIEDLFTSTAADPVTWNAASIRGIVDCYGSWIGDDPINPYSPPAGVGTTGTYIQNGGVNPYRFFGYGPMLDIPSYFVRLVCRADRMGEPTIYSAWKTACLAVLASLPRSPAGAVWIDPNLTTPEDEWGNPGRPSHGSAFLDHLLILSGSDSFCTTLTIRAYQELQHSANRHGDAATAATCASNITSLCSGLTADLRITSGDYVGMFCTSTNEPAPLVPASCMALRYGMIPDAGQQATLAATLVAAYTGTAPFTSNVLTSAGGTRLIAAPYYFAYPSNTNAPNNVYRNGCYELMWTADLCGALSVAGRADLAAQLAQASVDEIRNVQNVDGPWEYANAGGGLGTAANGYWPAPRFPSAGSIFSLEKGVTGDAPMVASGTATLTGTRLAGHSVVVT